MNFHLLIYQAWDLSVENLSRVLRKYLVNCKWVIHKLPRGAVCITAQKGVDLILKGHSPMDLARWANGPEATYEGLSALSPTTKDLCSYISSRLGSNTVLDIL